MASIALRNLWSRKLRTFLTGFAVVLGVMMIAGTYVLTDSISKSFDDIFTESNQGIDAVVQSKEVVETDAGDVPPMDASILEQARKVPGVAEAAGTIADQQTAVIDSDGERVGGNGAPGLALSVVPDRFDPLNYEEGSIPKADDEVVLDVATADKAGYELGDTVIVSGAGGTRDLRLVGTAKLGDSDGLGGATIAEMTLPTAQAVTGKQGKIDQVLAAAAEGTSPEQLAKNLTDALPSTVEAETGEQNTQDQKDDINEGIGFLTTALLVFAGVSLFVASFLIFNTFSITVAQRTREFAMLRTLGANRRQIISSVIAEAFLIGLLASIAGLLVGIGFASVLQSLFKALEIDLPKSGTVVENRTIILCLCIGTGLTVMSALAPALRATRVSPVEGLREGAVLSTPKEGRIRAAIGVVLAAIGIALMLYGLLGGGGAGGLGAGAVAVFLGVALLSPKLVGPLAALVGRPLARFRGVPGRIAHENSVRNPGRTASTAAALMIGVALVAFVAIFAAGIKGSIDNAIDDSIVADLFLANDDGFSDVPAAVDAQVAAVPGVAAASPLRYTKYGKAPNGPGGGYITLVSPQTAADVLRLDWQDGGTDELLTNLKPNEVVVDANWADDHAFEAGSTFPVLTASGQTLEYTVTGTFEDKTDFIGNYAASDANAAAYNEADTLTNVLIDIDDGADQDAVRSEIETKVDKGFPTVKVQNQQELKDQIGGQLNGLLGGIYALLALAVIVSLFGIVNTLALSIYERTRELGLLRAVGTSRSQVRRIVRYEAVITAMIGAVLGSGLGVLFAVLVSRPLADEGFVLKFPWATLIALLVLAAVAGVIAAIGPARRASKLDTLEALAYE
jgi:putative ABC transport system permease protein